jgi:hypothetical protein
MTMSNWGVVVAGYVVAAIVWLVLVLRARG